MGSLQKLCGGKNVKQEMHWRKWEDLFFRKCSRGMGFRNMHLFDEALSKQAWRNFDVPNCLVCILKRKYFSNYEFLDSRLHNDPNYSWRNVWGAKALLQEGLVRRLSNWADIQIWEDK